MNGPTEDALTIWQAGVDAVASERLVLESVEYHGGSIRIGQRQFVASEIDRIIVVGAGKAGTGMASALEEIFAEDFAANGRLKGWVNVPAGCERQLDCIHIHPARPQGINEPTEAGCEGTRQMLALLESAGPNDLCICLLSGGGSALMPAPSAGITLADKVAVTRHLSAAGANIDQLNTVRKQLSDVKGGGLLQACQAGMLVTLIISDVLGDPLDIIASGPTVPNTTGPHDALAVLEEFGAREAGIAPAVFDLLRLRGEQPQLSPRPGDIYNLIIGNNATAVSAAAARAVALGYATSQQSAASSEGLAETVAASLCDWVMQCLDQRGRHCLVSGGEPVVELAAASERGRGGRNQQLVLAALQRLMPLDVMENVVVLSGGTDGEDGPTDAAGAYADRRVAQGAADAQLDLADHLRRNDAYTFFEHTGGLIQTGPTHTNVCDVRVVIVNDRERVLNPRIGS